VGVLKFNMCTYLRCDVRDFRCLCPGGRGGTQRIPDPVTDTDSLTLMPMLLCKYVCRFDPERFSADRMQKLPQYAFAPFGFGKRKCLAHRFGMADVSVLLAKLLRSGLKFDLLPGQTVKAKYDISCRPSEEVWITLGRNN